MNMIVHDDGHTNVMGHDALEPLGAIALKNHAFAKVMGIYRDSEYNPETGKVEDVVKRDERKGFSKIPTNPPFGAVIKEELHAYLKSYELSRYVGKGGGKDEDDPEDAAADPIRLARNPSSSAPALRPKSSTANAFGNCSSLAAGCRGVA